MRVLVGVTGASGAPYALEFLKRCHEEKYVVFSRWGREVFFEETEIKPSDLDPLVSKIFRDEDLRAPFSSGSNFFDAYVIIPCSTSTLGKIAAGFGDTLITRCAQVAMKERRRMVLCVRETPMSSLQLENALELSRNGVIIMPASPPFYSKPKDKDELIGGYVERVCQVLGLPSNYHYREEELD
ncbi:MAG: UbiX family flavin prenyltransferase [Acidobacteria bacterium]|nr:UbiX family flavin prenyltransferase [Acidobacteriota bacterium]